MINVAVIFVTALFAGIVGFISGFCVGRGI